MSEFDDTPNVTRLPVHRAPAERQDGLNIREQVSQLLAEAEPAPEPAASDIEPQWMPARITPEPGPASELGPAPGHRNGILCPQCDRWTWQATQNCIYCGYDLFAHAKRRAQERHQQWTEWRRRQLSRWGLGLFIGGLVAIYLAPKAPAFAESALTWGGLIALLGALLCGKLMPQKK